VRQSLTAETIALRALSSLAADPEALGRFLTSTGIDGAALRAQAANQHLLRGVLEFLLSQEELLIRFCESENVEARSVHLAAARLSV